MLLTGLLVFLSIGYVQSKSLVDGLNRWQKVSIATESAKNIAFADITAVNRYVSGTTMDLKFTISFNSDEYGDYVEMEFPTEFTLITASNPIVPTAAGSTNPLSLNDIEGQKISWGSQNDFGGMSSGTYNFFVTVSVNASATGDLEVSYTISGDEFGDPPHEDVTGTLSIEELPDVPDLKPMATGFFTEYYAVPIGQVTSTVRANVINIGSTLTDATNVTVKNADNSFSGSIAITTPMNTDAEEDFAFTGYTPEHLGDEVFVFTAEADDDYDTDNSTDTVKIKITATDLIRDNGIVVETLNMGQFGDMVGNIFTICKKDTLSSVISFHVDPTIGDSLKAVVYSLDENGVPETQLGISLNVIYTGNNREYTMFFPDGVILDEGRYFIGLKGGSHHLRLGITSTSYTEGTAWAYYSNAWHDSNVSGFKHVYYIRPQFGTELPEFDIELLNLDIYGYAVKNDDVTIKGVLNNKGLDAMTSVDMAYSVNGGTPVVQTFTNLKQHELIPFEMTTKLALPDVGDYNIKVYLSNPNGVNDADLSNDTLSTTVTAIEYAPSKRIFGEEGTGTWCGWCVAGHVDMDSLKQKYPDTWIGVAVHHNDIMDVEEYSNVMDVKINASYPSGLVNRTNHIYGPSNFEEAYLLMINQVSPVEISLNNINFNNESRELTFDIDAKFFAALNGARFNAVITENNVTGTTSDYDQKNYYSGGEHGEMGGYENLPNPVPAADMVYQHVARAILGGWGGTENSLPATVSSGAEESHTYTITLDENWDKDNIKIIGFVIAEDGIVLNSIKGGLHTGISLNSANNNISVYPNPFNNAIVFDNINNAKQIVVSNIIGQAVMSVDVTNNSMVVNTTGLHNGVYIISIIDNMNSVSTIKMVKQ